VYAVSLAVAVGGLSYAAVPLYKVFCQATGYGGTTQKATEEKFKGMRPVEGARQITVHFSADTSAAMPWTFKPQQRSVRVVPGETALAFYTAHNPTAGPVTGVSTYNITPMRAAPYFNKIQCFCFEEQRLRPNEEIDMPVFFFIDPEFLNDPAMKNIQSITLAYCFHRTGELSVLDIQTELKKREVEGEEAKKKVQAWAEGVAARTGVALPGGGGGGGAATPSPAPVLSPPQVA
jgi:cytochrome c oxidase assembly protein subunit 11